MKPEQFKTRLSSKAASEFLYKSFKKEARKTIAREWKVRPERKTSVESKKERLKRC